MSLSVEAGHGAADQAHGAVDEDAGRLAVARRGGSGRRTGPSRPW